MVGALVNERCNLVRVLDPVREGRSNKLALNLIFSVKADKKNYHQGAGVKLPFFF